MHRIGVKDSQHRKTDMSLYRKCMRVSPALKCGLKADPRGMAPPGRSVSPVREAPWGLFHRLGNTSVKTVTACGLHPMVNCDRVWSVRKKFPYVMPCARVAH